jgi:glycosyltransferase involved in cell wall biosynthesis
VNTGTSRTADILMVTYDSPESTELCLSRLLDTCGDHASVWLWHNGDHRPTLDVVEKYRHHPRVARFHHCPENLKLWTPTNWLLENSKADYLSKVDDDNLLPHGWIETLMAAHEAVPGLGVLGCWRFADEDFVPELANRKIKEFPGGHRVMLNLWTEGSCFLMKSRCRDDNGLLEKGQSFPQYCKKLAMKGWQNGYYFPFVKYENLDDPRAPHTLIRSDEDFRRSLPLTAQYNGVSTMEEWTDQLRRSARAVQSASADPDDWRGWRQAWRSLRLRARKLVGIRNSW